MSFQKHDHAGNDRRTNDRQVSVTTVLATIREGDDIRTIASRLVNEYNLNFTEEQFIEEAKRIDKY